MSKAVRYELREISGELAYIRLPEGLPLPVRAEGFLRFSPAKDRQMFVEVRNGEILAWVEKKSVNIPKRRV